MSWAASSTLLNKNSVSPLYDLGYPPALKSQTEHTISFRDRPRDRLEANFRLEFQRRDGVRPVR